MTSGQSGSGLRGLLRGSVVVLLLALGAVLPSLVWAGADPSVTREQAGPLGLLVVLQLLGLRTLRVHRRSWRRFSLRDSVRVTSGLLLGTGVFLVLGVAGAAAESGILALAASLRPEIVGSILLASIPLQVLPRALRRLARGDRRLPEPPQRPDAPHDTQRRVVSALRPADHAALIPRTIPTEASGDIARLVAGRSVVITGAAGSVGSELARQLTRHHPSRLILIDRAEQALWALAAELEGDAPLGAIDPMVLDVRDQQLLTGVLDRHAPVVVFHAAAFKHVPLLERNVAAAVLNNAIGTASVAEACIRTGVTRMVLLSTDEAVSPTSVLGATMRIAERAVSDAGARSGRDFVSVRFGNVLGSPGSVLDVFTAQIAAGGPITITDPEMTRHFLTAPEAGALVLQAATLSGHGDVLVLDVGEPRRIVDLAEDLVRLHGLEPGRDIELIVTGRRAGERLHGQLVAPHEDIAPTDHPSILGVRSLSPHWPDRDKVLLELRDLARRDAVEQLRARLLEVANEGPGDGGRRATGPAAVVGQRGDEPLA
jgi:nucleoside-diphosphate-sugar epimerase